MYSSTIVKYFKGRKKEKTGGKPPEKSFVKKLGDNEF